MALTCIQCKQPLPLPHKCSIVTITKGECAEFFEIDIGNSLSQDFPMHPDCAKVVRVTKRLVGIDKKGHTDVFEALYDED